MDYLKLFEQNWWENAKDHGEKIPPVNIDGMVLISGTMTSYHIADKIENDIILELYKGYKYGANLSNNGRSIIESPDDVNKNGIINVYNGKSWETYTFAKLPKEIKDKLIWIT